MNVNQTPLAVTNLRVDLVTRTKKNGAKPGAVRTNVIGWAETREPVAFIHELPRRGLLGNWASGVRNSRKLGIRYCPILGNRVAASKGFPENPGDVGAWTRGPGSHHGAPGLPFWWFMHRALRVYVYIAHIADPFVSAHPTVSGQKLGIVERQSFCLTQ